MQKSNLQLEGERVNLRSLKPNDVESLMENAKDLEIAQYTTVPHPYSIEKANDFIENGSGKKDSTLELGVELGGNIIGMASLTSINKDSKRAEIGYWLGKKYWRNGYMIEAVKLLLKYAFEELGLERVYAKVMHPNNASTKLLENLGFIQEARMRKGVLRRGEWLDELIYGMIREDYEKKEL